ncbi:MAG TPA: YciI family protein [Actinomycetaceae bacterium]|nr:YciI family protein [Actinomycetaceae bacterium]
MAYLIDCVDKPDGDALRQQTRDAHLAYLTENADRLLLAGAKWTDDGQTALGSVLIVDVETREQAEAFAAADPYSRAGLFEEVKVTHYRVAFLDRTNRLPA